MTALAPLIDANGIAYLAADGLVVNPDGTHRDEYGIKTARLNDSVCVGFAGETGYGNQLLAHLFRRSELAAIGEHVDLGALFEVHDITAPDRTYERAREWISWQLAALRDGCEHKGQELPGLNLVLIGASEHGPRFSVWQRIHDWGIEQCGIWSAGCTTGFALGPIPDKHAYEALRNSRKRSCHRLRDCIRVFAKASPELVNRNVLIRSSEDGFRITDKAWPLPKLPWPAVSAADSSSNLPAQDSPGPLDP